MYFRYHFYHRTSVTGEQSIQVRELPSHPAGCRELTRGPLAPNTRHALPEAAAVLLPVGDPLAGADRFGDRWYRIQQLEAGLMVHRATLAATAGGLAARIHSEGTKRHH